MFSPSLPDFRRQFRNVLLDTSSTGLSNIKMKTFILAFSVSAISLIAIPSISHAANEKGGFFVNGTIGQADLNKGFYDDSDRSYSIDAGYRWAFAPAFAFGIEGGYTDLGSYSPDVVSVSTPNGEFPVGDAEVSGVTLGVNAHWNLTDTWYLSGRAGAFKADIKGNFMAVGYPFWVEDSSLQGYAGIGVGYDFSDKFGLGLTYDRYKAGKYGLDLDTDVASVSGEFRF